MKVAFRTDASKNIGTGHVMRCLTLADALHIHGIQCIFICREHPGNLISLIEKKGHITITLQNDFKKRSLNTNQPYEAWLGTDWRTDGTQTSQALYSKEVDWLVVDHYALDSRWERLLRPYTKRMMVIDDLANRPHDCHLLLNQNLGRNSDDYVELLDPSAKKLIGPQYSLIRPEFAALRKQSLQRRVDNPKLDHLLVTMGGIDKDNFTGQVLKALKKSRLPPELQITVIMGAHSPWLKQVLDLANQMPWPTEVLKDVDNMAQIMTNSDLAIGAAGSTTWERCCMGLPTIQLAIAPNQLHIASALERIGAATLCNSYNITRELPLQLANISKTKRLKDISHTAANIVDGAGVERVWMQMKEESHENHLIM